MLKSPISRHSTHKKTHLILLSETVIEVIDFVTGFEMRNTDIGEGIKKHK
jgi:hypothetical protein